MMQAMGVAIENRQSKMSGTISAMLRAFLRARRRQDRGFNEGTIQ